MDNLCISLSKAKGKSCMSECDITDCDCTIDELCNSFAKADDKLGEALSECNDLTFDVERALEHASHYKSEWDNNYKKVEKSENKLDDKNVRLQNSMV